MKKVVLAEKPSVGRELARVLNCYSRTRGYIEGPDYIVTWALGHLVELAQPADYRTDWKRWSLGSLPMLPEPLEQRVIEQSRPQFEIVKSILNRDDVDSLIIATDAGREGELVARWIMKLSNWKGETRRLWISSQTDTAIRQGFENLKDASLYDNLYRAAFCRAAADWYIGMNVTRALTCKYDAKITSGRVQTPTLALMTEREKERQKFSGSFYWNVRAFFAQGEALWCSADGSTRITDEKFADSLTSALAGKKGKVVSVERKEVVEPPPLAYDLTELQRDANILLDFPAKKTLDVLQKLYEVHKIVTYPRTDSRYITQDIVATLSDRLSALKDTSFGLEATRMVREGYRVSDKRFVQDLEVTDHHAIIPTEQRVNLTRLSEDEKNLWTLIVTRFIEVLSEDYIYDSVTVMIEVEGNMFRSRFTSPKQRGWKAVSRRSLFSSADELPMVVSTGDEIVVEKVTKRRYTTPIPARYTDATLLGAMEHAGRFVQDSDVKQHLSGGLGTPATRADVIEKLVQYHYVQRDGKDLVPTPKGMEVVRLAPSELCSPILTGRWEERLSAIAKGEENADRFIADIKTSALSLVDEIAASRDSYSPAFSDSKRCPYCDADMMAVVEKGETHYICQRLSCSYEEKIVKKMVKVNTPAPVPAVKKPVVVRKAVSASAGPKKRVVLKKKPVVKAVRKPLPYHFEYKNEVEVVRPSKRARRRENTYIPKNYAANSGNSSSGVTFADLIKASQKRNKRRK